jgi:hypothetical protein
VTMVAKSWAGGDLRGGLVMTMMTAPMINIRVLRLSMGHSDNEFR